MDEANINILTGRIQRSVLLSPDRADALLAALPTLDDEQVTALSTILDNENGFTEVLAERVVTDAIALNDGDTLARIDAITGSGAKRMRATEETTERTNEQDAAEHLFDTTA